jgi:WD40 repeat protein
VTSAAFSPDGTLLVTASADGTAQVWNEETRTPFGTMKHGAPLMYAEFSSNGLIVTASEDGTAKLWAVPRGPVGTMKETRILKPTACNGKPDSAPVRKARFSPDGRLVVTAWGGGTAQVWNTASNSTGQPIACLQHDGSVFDAAFDGDGKRIVTASYDGTAQVLLDVASCQPRPENCQTLRLSDGAARKGLKAARFNDDASSVALASDDGTVKIWSLATGKKLGDLPTEELGAPPAPGAPTVPVSVVQFSSDGKWLVVASEAGKAWVWETERYQKRYPISAGDNGKLPAHRGAIYDVEFDRAENQSKLSGPKFLTASADGTAQVWSIVCPDSQSCAAMPPDKVVLQIGAPRSHRHAVYTAAFNSDGKKILTASADHTARVWYTTQSNQDDAPGNESAFKVDQDILSADLTRDGKFMALALKDGKVEVRDLDTSKALWVPKDSVPVNKVQFSSDGRWIVAAANDNTIRIWDARTGTSLVTPFRPDGTGGETGHLHTAVLSPDGRWLAAASSYANQSGTVQVWEVSHSWLFDATPGWVSDRLHADPHLRLTNQKTFSHSTAIVALEFDRNGESLLTIAKDGKARLLGREKGETRQTFPHNEPVNSATFSPDGKWILTASLDNTARTWRAADGHPVAELTHKLPVLDASFSGDGALIVTVSYGRRKDLVNAEIRIFDAARGLPLGPPLPLKGETPSWVRFRHDDICVASADVPLPLPDGGPPPERNVWDRQVQLSNPGHWGSGELKDLLETVSGYTVQHGVSVPPETKLLDIREIAKSNDPNAAELAALLLHLSQQNGTHTVCAPSSIR